MIEGGKSAGENPAGKLYTVADIEALPVGERAELINGEMFMMASPTLTHQDILGWLNMTIRMYITNNKGECKILPAPFAVYIKDDIHNYVEPDISVICDKEKLDEKGCHGAPDWVIEVVSPSSRHMDYERKLSLYEAAGVREYWIVDSEQRNVTVYGLEHKEGPKIHFFSERVKAGIYEDLFLDFSELE
ncbi:MAG: Uma2 family endonuclease [Lachnospiraceae bacterium]|nr:Uma2 family endonuclease [Lachnospiraceae bacterium]